MAKQVWAGVMKKVVVRQKKVRKVWGSERDGEIQTHDTCKRGRDRTAHFQISCNRNTVKTE